MFANQIALVTGGGSGIGREVVNLLAEKKASVVIADYNISGANSTLQLIEKFSDSKHIAVEVDVSKIVSIKQMFKVVKCNYIDKDISLLVNCAGITRDKLFVNMSEQDFDEVIAVNVKGTFLVTQLFCQKLLENKINRGSIVNVSSISAKVGNFGQTNYNASKAAVEALTRTVAREMAKYHIRCNAVAPGIIDTEILKSVPKQVLDNNIASVPLKRIGKPVEVAEAILFLLSNHSEYITGSIIQVSGGLAM